MSKKKRAELVKSNKPTGMETMQAGPRSTNSMMLNYNSVSTLDPSRLASAFASADMGFITDQATLFELIEEQDPHIFAELAKRRRSVTGLGWQLKPPRDANQSEIDRTAELSDMIQSIPRFEDAQYDLTDAIGKGICALEIDWKTGDTWLPQALNFVPQRMFQIDRESGALMYLKMGMPEALRDWGWIVHEHRAKSGYIEQSALFRVLAWTYAYKAYNIRDMQRFLEVYGLPLRLGKYPAGIGAKQRDELLRAVRNIGNDGAGVVPSTMSIDFIEAQGGKVDDFCSAVAYWEQKQSIAILGGTLTSRAEGKSSTNALGKVHDKVRREIMLHDVRQIEPTLNNQLLRPIVLLNGMFPADRMPSLKYDTAESVDQQAMIEVLGQGVDIGMEIDVEWAHQTMQIPRAAKGAKLLVSSGKLATPTQADAALVRLAALAKQASESDVTGAYSAQLAALCAPYEQAMIQQISAAVAEAGDFETALASIEALTTNPVNSAWIKDLALGMSAANLAGRAAIGGEQ